MSRLVTDHLPLLAGAPNGVKKLRELILELAVRGKLVPQDLADEPADRLLQRIQAKKYKSTDKHKKSTPIEDIESIPVGWVKTTFQEAVLEIATGPFGSLVHQSDYIYGGIPLINPSHMVDGKISSDPAVSLPEVIASSLGAYRLEPGDMVMARRGEIGRVALVTEKERGWLCGTGSFRLRFTADIEPRFLRVIFCTPSVRKQLAGKAVGTTMVNLNHGVLSQLPFLLPPLPEQHRIVAKVDELMALCDRLETRQSDAQAAHARLVDELLGSLLQARDAEEFAECWGRVKGSFDVLFTTEQSVDDLKRIFLSLAVTGKLSSSKELGNIGWHTGPFNDLIDPLFPIAYGVLVPGPETAGGIPFVRIADLSISSASAQPEKTISPDVDAKFSRTRLRGGEILMGVVGSIGKLGVAPDSWAGANIARAICRIVPNAKVCKAYMLWLLQSDVMQKQFIGDTRTLAQPTLNVGMIRSAVASIPPLAEQYRIVEKIDEFMVLCDQIKAKMARAQALNERLAGTLVERAVL